MATHFGQTGMTDTQGDFNGDGTVNALDFNILATKFGTKLAAPSMATALSDDVPVTNSSSPSVADMALPNLFADRPIPQNLLENADF